MTETTARSSSTSWTRRLLLPAGARLMRRRRYAWQVALGGAGFALSFIGSTGARPAALELDTFRVVNGLPDALSPVLLVVGQAGALGAIFVFAALALMFWRPRLAGAILVSGLTVYLLAKVVKRNIERGRPVEYVNEVIIHGPAQVGLGFPSGHAAVIGAVATVASPYLTRPMRVVVWTAAGLVVLTRVYIGAHLPLDTIGGFFLGWAVGSAVNLVYGTPVEQSEGAPASAAEDAPAAA
jgi:undecaprenyl-diphosphatase